MTYTRKSYWHPQRVMFDDMRKDIGMDSDGLIPLVLKHLQGSCPDAIKEANEGMDNSTTHGWYTLTPQGYDELVIATYLLGFIHKANKGGAPDVFWPGNGAHLMIGEKELSIHLYSLYAIREAHAHGGEDYALYVRNSTDER